MLDVLFVGVTVGFFLLAIGYVRVCESFSHEEAQQGTKKVRD